MKHNRQILKLAQQTDRRVSYCDELNIMCRSCKTHLWAPGVPVNYNTIGDRLVYFICSLLRNMCITGAPLPSHSPVTFFGHPLVKWLQPVLTEHFISKSNIINVMRYCQTLALIYYLCVFPLL